MSKVATIITIGGMIQGYLASEGGKAAAEASAEGTALQVEFQREALDYLKEVEAMPRYYREQAMQILGTEFGLAAPPPPAAEEAEINPVTGQPIVRDAQGTEVPEFITERQRIGGRPGPGGRYAEVQVPNPAYEEARQVQEQQQQQTALEASQDGGPAGKAGLPAKSPFEMAVNHPLYKQLYKGIEDSRVEISTDRMLKRAEESVMRSANISGGFRGGGMQRQLLETGADIDERKQLFEGQENRRIIEQQNAALVDSYNRQISGLSGFAGLPSYAENIAETTAGIGETEGAGVIAQGQIEQQRQQNIGGAVVGGFENYIEAKKAGLLDRPDNQPVAGFEGWI